MPGGGQAAYLAAIGSGPAPTPAQDTPAATTTSTNQLLPPSGFPIPQYLGTAMDPFAISGFGSGPELDEANPNATQPFNMNTAGDADAAMNGNNPLEALFQIHSAKGSSESHEVGSDYPLRTYDHPPPIRGPQKFGDWDRDEDGGENNVSSSDSSDSEELSDNDPSDNPPAHLASRSAIKTVPGYGAREMSNKTSAKSVAKTRLGSEKRIDVDDFSGVPHVGGFVTLAAFESIVDQEREAINPFCLTPAVWDRGIRVVNAYFRTKRTDDIEKRFLEFLLLFSLVQHDFIDNQLAMTRWFYEQRCHSELTIGEAAAASGAQPKLRKPQTNGSCSDDAQEAYRCYVCGEKLYSFRKLDVHFQVFHSYVRRTEVSSAYRTWWQTKMQAMGLEVENREEGGSPTEFDLACHLCDIPFEDVDSIDRHFYVEHRKERKAMLLRLFDKKFRDMKEAALVDLYARYHAAAGN